MKKTQIYCPYCGDVAVLRPANHVHRSSALATGKHLYVCRNWPKCDSYVGVHEYDRTPMGTLANGDLRHKRILAHKALEKYQRITRMDRWATYLWLEGKLGLDKHSTHIGMFSEETCDAVIALCENAVKAYKAEGSVV